MITARLKGIAAEWELFQRHLVALNRDLNLHLGKTPPLITDVQN
jgi:hypothetical protein